MISCRPLSLILLVALPCSAMAERNDKVDVDQLWIPKSYLRHLTKLYDAAQMVERTSRCHEFVSGEIALDESTLAHPIFSFECRDANGETYGFLVDGLALKKLDDTRPGGMVSFEQLEKEYPEAHERALERERKRQKLAERQEHLRLTRAERRRWVPLWERCQARLQQRVSNMAGLEWLTTEMPEPEAEVDPGEQQPVTFAIDFNARNLQGDPLHYRAFCTITTLDDYEFRIKARPEPDDQTSNS